MPQDGVCVIKEINSNSADNVCSQTVAQPCRTSHQIYRETCNGKAVDTSEGSRTSYFETELLDQYESDPFFALDFFRSAVFATILEDVLLAFNLLDECNNEIRILKTKDDLPRLETLKYGTETPESDELTQLRADICLDNVAMKLSKLERDRTKCRDVISRTYLNLTLLRSFRLIFDYLIYNNQITQYNPQLMEQEAQSKVQARMVARQYRQQRNNNKRMVYDADLIIGKMRSQIQDADQTTEIEARYVDRWQAARTEQHQENIGSQEDSKMHRIDSYKQMMDQEARVHYEIETLIAIAISEKRAQIELWMNKYDRDMEEMDLRIQIKRNNYENTMDRRRELEKTIIRRNCAMREWNKFKEDRAVAQRYAKTMLQSAIIVQAWWRGILVRLQLGPYRPKKKIGGKTKQKNNL